MKICISCGMPLDNTENIGAELDDGMVCIHCSTHDGQVKSCEEIFEGGVKFFMQIIPDARRDLAERLTRKNMNRLPYWQHNKADCLNGDEASDEEFAEMMAKLQ